MADSRSASVLKSLTPVLYLAAVAFVVALLWVAKSVLVPVALAILLTFVLRPLVKVLERRGLPRIAAVALVIVLLLAALGGFGYVLSRQFRDLSAQMTIYSQQMQDKVARLRGNGKGVIANITKTVTEVSAKMEEKAEQSKDGKAPRGGPQQVRMVPSEPTAVERFQTLIEPILEPLATTGVILVLLIFMLIQREDHRDRLIRLVGQGKVTLTTRTMDEAAERISRFLLAQLMINTGFGILVALGLFWIGVPYAALWGFAATILRFVPYVGSMLAMLLPTILAFVKFPGWGQTFATLGLYLGMDVVTANVVEPILIGHRTGVSSMALLVSAMFWTWIWGPIGLVLSTPITVCLVVLGKHVAQLEFLGILLGDEPALETDISFYQRLLAGDEDEASEIVEGQLQTNSREQVFDSVLVPTLVLAERDRVRAEISDSDQQFVLRATRDILQTLAEADAQETKASAPANGNAVASKPHGHIVGVPARNAADEIALEMLVQLFDPLTCTVERLTSATLGSELVLAVEKASPDLVCILALPPGGLAHARYLCKRLRARFPEVRILVVRPGLRADSDKTVQRLTEAGADRVTTTLTEARSQATQLLLPALVRPVEPDSRGALDHQAAGRNGNRGTGS